MSGLRSALFLHGAGGGGWEWNLWRGVFEHAGIAVHAPDLQPTAAGVAPTVFADYQRQAEAALRALPRPRAVIGASLGGLLAACVADDADALVLVNPLPCAPWHAQLAPRQWADVVRWRHGARLASTRDALAESDAATVLFAYRRWRDESGAVLRHAHAGVSVAAPRCPVLFVLSADDEEIPLPAMQAMANAWYADVRHADTRTHVGPLLGRQAAATAHHAVEWLNGAGDGRRIQPHFTSSRPA